MTITKKKLKNMCPIFITNIILVYNGHNMFVIFIRYFSQGHLINFNIIT